MDMIRFYWLIVISWHLIGWFIEGISQRRALVTASVLLCYMIAV